MKDSGRGEAETGSGNRVIELTHDDEIFLVAALRLASMTQNESSFSAVLNGEGERFEAEIHGRLSDEFLARANFIGSAWEVDDHRRVGETALGLAQARIEADTPMPPNCLPGQRPLPIL